MAFAGTLQVFFTANFMLRRDSDLVKSFGNNEMGLLRSKEQAES
jgi:hypothetical protein